VRSWHQLLEREARRARALIEIGPAIDPGHLVFELRAFTQEANFTHQLTGQRRSFERAREGIHPRLRDAATARSRRLLKPPFGSP
jgi:hypothetical protein